MSSGSQRPGSSLTGPDEPSYSKVLMLGAIAAASAFVVTIFIVLVCVGCQRKSKSKHPSAGEKGTSVNLPGTLRHPNLNSMSKSDTRLHEINRFGNGVNKNRPASMDLLLLHSQQPPREPLPRSPSPRGGAPLREVGGSGGGGGGETREHTYTEVGLRNTPTPSRCLDDGLYESVGVREGSGDPQMPPAPPPTSANTPAAARAAPSPAPHGGGHGGNGGRGNGLLNRTMRGRVNGVNGVNGVNRSPLSSLNSLANQEPPPGEYASIHMFRKGDKTTRKETNDSQSDSQSSVSDSPSAHPPPPLHRSQELPRKPLEPFHLHSFPKEAVFIGNGEQYIWKPPEDDDIITLHPPPNPADSRKGQPPAPTPQEIADTYSTVCKPQKKKPPGEYNGAKTLPRSFRGDSGRGGAMCSRGRGVQAQARSHEEPCYRPSGAGDRAWSACDPNDPDAGSAYGNIPPQRTQPGGAATLKRKKQPPQPPLPPPQLKKAAAVVVPPPPPPPPISGSPAPPARAAPGGEDFYQSVGELKPASGEGKPGSGTTTIFTFNDGMEMYVTGL